MILTTEVPQRFEGSPMNHRRSSNSPLRTTNGSTVDTDESTVPAASSRTRGWKHRLQQRGRGHQPHPPITTADLLIRPRKPGGAGHRSNISSAVGFDCCCWAAKGAPRRQETQAHVTTEQSEADV